MNANPSSWRSDLDRLIAAPALSAAQARYLLENLGVPRPEILNALLDALQSDDASRAEGATFLLSAATTGADRAVIQEFVVGKAPLTVRALARQLYQQGLLTGRLTDEEAEVTPAPAEALDFLVEDVAREISRVGSPWQRARFAAEALVGDAPLSDDAAPAAVAALSRRLDVDAPRVWAELLIHPLTRPSFRAAAAEALKTPSHEAATQLELASEALLPGDLLERARTEAPRHRTAPVTWRARVSTASGTGRVAVQVWTDGPQPTALAALVALDGSTVQFRAETGRAAEQVLVLGQQMLQATPPAREVPVPWALGLLTSVAPAKDPKGKKKPGPWDELRAWVDRIATASSSAPQALAPVPSAGEVPAGLAEHPLLSGMEVSGSDLSNDVKQAMGKELRKSGRVREETIQAAAREVTGKRGILVRISRAVEHAARLAAATDDKDAPALASLAAALPSATPPATAFATAITRRAILASTPPQEPIAPSRDQLREDVLHGNRPPTGVDVLALDLAAAAFDSLGHIERGLEEVSVDLLAEMCAAAGMLGARALLQPVEGVSEDNALADAAREAIRQHGAKLPSRVRQSLVDAWVAAFKELVTNACRGTCQQRCLDEPTRQRPLAAYSLDHPRHNRPWPSPQGS
ncbi:MAG: hypothetical protein AB2A00_35075 [Myxococcota bacterium]